MPRRFSLMSPRMPRLHSIKGPFKLVLGGILVDPPWSRTRRTPFKLIERFPDQSQGQFRFNREDGYIYRPLTLVSGGDTTGAWRKVYCSVEYPRLVFKLMPSTEDMSLLRLRRSVPLGKPDYTAQVVQEFHCWVSLCEPEKLEGAPHHPVQQVHSIYWYANAWCHYLVLIYKDVIQRKLHIDLPLLLQWLRNVASAFETAENRIGDLVCAMVVWFPFSSMGTDGSGLNLMIHCLESGRQRSLLEVSGLFSPRFIPKRPPKLSIRFIGRSMAPNSMLRVFVLSC